MTADPRAAKAPRGHDLVAVAASAGGVEALKVFLALLPRDLPATVLVALHLPATARSVLADILARVAGPRVELAVDGAELLPHRVLVGPPDRHLLVRDGRVVLGRGPTENGHRPSHDAMLRAVALEAGPSSVGVVLTGLLDDGAAGLAAVRRYGGRCFVQDPADADFSSMPRAALRAVPDAVADDLTGLVERVVQAVHASADDGPEITEEQRVLDLAELTSAVSGTPVMPDSCTPGRPSPFSCPDCHGVLNVVPDAGLLRFRCRTGHAWTSESLEAQQQEQVEEALWIALRVLEERSDLSRRLSEQAERDRRDWSSAHHTRRADEASQSAAVIRSVLSAQVVQDASVGAVPPDAQPGQPAETGSLDALPALLPPSGAGG